MCRKHGIFFRFILQIHTLYALDQIKEKALVDEAYMDYVEW